MSNTQRAFKQGPQLLWSRDAGKSPARDKDGSFIRYAPFSIHSVARKSIVAILRLELLSSCCCFLEFSEDSHGPVHRRSMNLDHLTHGKRDIIAIVDLKASVGLMSVDLPTMACEHVELQKFDPQSCAPQLILTYTTVACQGDHKLGLLFSTLYA